MTTPAIKTELAVLHSSDGLVDLFCLDASALGGSVEYFSPQCYSDGTLLSWGGQAYQLVPIGIDSLEKKATNSQLPQPSLTISNVGAPVLAQVVALGDLTNAKLTHWKTKVSYLDGQANPDTTKFIGPEVWYIYQKTAHNNQMIQWTLSCPIDMPGYMFPVRQVLKYQGINPGPGDTYFPGVSAYRIAGS
jgi:lambda family phage minor tail protein L